MARRPPGKRDSGLDVGPELAQALGDKILLGWSIASAAESMGVNRCVIYQWLEQGKGPRAKEPYKSFANTLKMALGKARGDAEAKVHRGDSNWCASARWLESMDPETWRRTERREVQGGAQPIAVDLRLGASLLEQVVAAARRPGVADEDFGGQVG